MKYSLSGWSPKKPVSEERPDFYQPALLKKTPTPECSAPPSAEEDPNIFFRGQPFKRRNSGRGLHGEYSAGCRQILNQKREMHSLQAVISQPPENLDELIEEARQSGILYE